MPSNLLPIEQPNKFCNWLQNELDDVNSIIPHTNPIPDNLSGVKGIYFWFMKFDGYVQLRLSEIDPVCKRKINGKEFHLVYLGTAGTNRKQKNDLFKRLKWHIENKHTKSAICSGALSTLRQGLGSLLSNDLILHNTEELVNDFLKSYMRIYWISYTGQENLINRDELALIQHIKPLLNIKNNPNARANAHINPTGDYKLRRIQIIQSSRKRLNCKKELKKEMKKNDPNKNIISRFKEHILSGKENYLEFFVRNNQSIAEVVRGIPDLPTGKVNCIMYDSANPNHRVFPKWGKTGGSGKQNIYTYFANTGGKDYRYKLIQNYMKKNKIKEITVRVCSNDKKQDTEQKNKSKNSGSDLKNNNTDQEKIELSKNFIVVMICSKEKYGANLWYADKEIKFKAKADRHNNQYLPDDLLPDKETTWRKYIYENQTLDKLPLKAYELYKDKSYLELHKKFKKRFYILSAGWGLVRADFRLPNYDITFSSKEKPDPRRIYNCPPYSDFNQLKIKPDEDIIFIGTPDYLNLFFTCTQNLANRKIVYFISNNMPNYPNDTFIYVRYDSKGRSSGWYYSLAKDIIDGIIPKSLFLL